MAKFILIDQSLRDLGGHHYPYAYSVLTAAQQAGWEPVLAVNRDFLQRAALPASWRVHALYARKSYSHYSLDTQARAVAAPTAPDARRLPRWRRWWTRHMRARYARGFARDCARLFELEPLGRGDLVFLATMSELDLQGLADFLERSTAVMDCDWHLQFHFGVFHGREPDYAAQGHAAGLMRASIGDALRRCGRQRLHLHCTTDPLAIQYRSLGVAAFDTLPYPVHELFQPRSSAAAPSAPLRIACLGHSRREKGYQQLPAILQALWQHWFGPGQARLVLQTRRTKERRNLESLTAALHAPGAQPRQALEFAGYPLPLAEYSALLCGVDVGLLLYDPTRYYARCSGVLLELLCAGVPVLVPAGSWLAEQIERENQRYLNGITAGAIAPVPLPPDGTLQPPPGARSLLISCRWRSPAPAGVYARLELRSDTADDIVDPPTAAVVAAGDPGVPVHCVFRLPARASRLRLSVGSAWSSAPPPVEAVTWSALDHDVPLGALGLTFPDERQVPRLLRELLEQISHYREHARTYAPVIMRAHDAAQVLACLGRAQITSPAGPWRVESTLTKGKE